MLGIARVFDLSRKGGEGLKISTWVEGGAASVGEECCAGGRSSMGGGVDNCSGLFGGVDL